MNPARFQNAGGMGRATPNNMQINTQGALTPISAGRFIIQTLHGQGPFSGWQATVPNEQRAQQVKLLVDSLRLLRPVIDYSQVVHVAINFELKAFMQSGNREQYIASCQEKLARIRDQRQQQVNPGDHGGQHTNMNPMQMQQMNPNMMFPPQPQQQMQASPMVNPQRVPQNMIN